MSNGQGKYTVFYDEEAHTITVYTVFNLSGREDLRTSINSLPGIEALGAGDVTRYKMSLRKGNMFPMRETVLSVQKVLEQYIRANGL